MPRYFSFLLVLIVVLAAPLCFAKDLDLSNAAVSSVKSSNPSAVEIASRVLIEETEKRTGISWQVVAPGTEATPLIQLKVSGSGAAESYSITTESDTVVLCGADKRGLLFAVGHFLRTMNWEPGVVTFPITNTGVLSPVSPIRGHQLGYRFRANSYDTWDDAQYEQYIRELMLFGCNSIENIPMEDDRESPHMPLDRRAMNRRMSEICQQYGLEYWVWTPAVFDLSEKEKRAAHIAEHIQLYKDCPELTGVFFPGGDPGANPPELVLPFLTDLSKPLLKSHPKAKIWLSLQWFDEKQCKDIYAWIERERPAWFGGLVSGPSSPSAEESRPILSDVYPIRDYPDITHTVRCQFPVPWWDPAFAMTLGRECINPRPVFYTLVHNYYAPYTTGFITYSDGIHDDVNKTIWSALGWDPTVTPRDTLIDYARFFFSSKHAEAIADGILAQEKNWEGPLAENGSVDATFALWRQLEDALPELADNWRWQMLLVRAYYDCYTRKRLLYETGLEEKVNTLLLSAKDTGAVAAIDASMAVLERAVSENIAPEMQERIIALYDALFHSIGLKSSVDKYQASGYERGCSLDFLDSPLNNRWFLEDEFQAIRVLPDESARLAALQKLATWENPGPGSFYDDVGDPGKSPHVKRLENLNLEPINVLDNCPGFSWWDTGFSRKRLSWQHTLNFPMTMVYTGLDPEAEYVLRMTGTGFANIQADGYALTPSIATENLEEIKEYPIPKLLTADQALTVNWVPEEQSELNWRKHSTVAEVWLIKR